MEKVEVLKRSELFRELNDEQLALVAEMATEESFEPGAVICKQGRIEEKMYVIEQGLVAIVLEVGQLAQRQVQAAADFEAFGWSAAIEPHVCTATVIAREKTKVLSFYGRELCDLCDKQPSIGCRVCRAVARTVASRLRQAYVQLLGVTAQD
jgi:CRP-like cAMP-binding protein